MLPASACQMPACAARRDGKLVMKSHDRRPAPSATMSQIERAEGGERDQQHEQRERLEGDVGDPPPGDGPAAACAAERDGAGLAHAYSSR